MLDAWPIIRHAERDATCAPLVEQLLRQDVPPIVSSINLGEVHYTLAKRHGFARADQTWEHFCLSARVEIPTLELTRSAARLVVSSRIPWADAHAAATALAHRGVVWAGDSHLNKPGPWKRMDLRKLDPARRPPRER